MRLRPNAYKTILRTVFITHLVRAAILDTVLQTSPTGLSKSGLDNIAGESLITIDEPANGTKKDGGISGRPNGVTATAPNATPDAGRIIKRIKTPERVCNGDPSYCSRRYSNITFVGAHDSAFHGNKFNPTNDQSLNFTDQLAAGVRFAEIQVHQKSAHEDVLELCHTKCIEKDVGPLRDYLADLREWLDKNPSEVFTLLLANDNDRQVDEFDKVFSAVGLNHYAFVPSTTPNRLEISDWPTLQEMIDLNTRLVVFMDYCADETKVPYILDQLSYTFSTPYDATDPGFNQCTLYQPTNKPPDGRMYIMNHFLDVSVFGILVPDSYHIYRTNAATGWGSIGDQAALCTSTYGRQPNFILVDMFNLGDAHLAERALNGLSLTLTAHRVLSDPAPVDTAPASSMSTSTLSSAIKSTSSVSTTKR